eukprot:gene11771-15006_t
MKRKLLEPGGGYYNRSGSPGDDATLHRLTVEQIERVEAAKTVAELYHIIGDEFYVSLDVQSSKDPNMTLRGTSLFAWDAPTTGQLFGVNVPSTLERYQPYDRELEWLFGEAVALLGVHLSVEAMDESRETRAARFDKIVDLSLRLFYYWVNLCPLTRGSAHTGYALMAAVVVAAGRPIDAGGAGRTSGGQRRIGYEGEQLDWEALLSESPDAFVKHKREAWIHRLDVSDLTDDVLDVADRALDVGIVYSTPAKVIGALANITELGNVSE